MNRIKLYVLACPILALSMWGIRHLVATPVSNEYSNAERFLQEIRHGLRPELAKILYVTERFRNKSFTVVYNRRGYDAPAAVAWARGYLQRNYRGEAAEGWIKKYLHRSPTEGEIIYLQFPGGNRLPLRDVLLDELDRIPA